METIKPDTNHQSSDPIDLAKLRYSQDYGNAVGVKKKITTVPVRNPFPQTFIRVHTGIDFQFETFLLDLKGEQ